MCYEYEAFEKSRIAERLRKSKEPSNDLSDRTEPQIPSKQIEPERQHEEEPVAA